MKKEDVHRYLLGVLEKKIPDRTKLVEMLMDTLFMEKGAIYRRLRGDVPFSFFEVASIAEKLNIPLNDLAYIDTKRQERFELNIVDYVNMNEAYYKVWDDYIALIGTTKDDPNSEIAESSNVLPISLYGKFDSLSKYYLFKFHYLSTGTERRTSFDELVIPERLRQINRTYFYEVKNFGKTVFLWDYLIFKYLVTDIHFFFGINLISTEDIRQIKDDLFALLDYIEKITLTGRFEETGNSVSFYISDVNFDGDYSYFRLNDLYVSYVRAFILNSVTSGDQGSFEKVKTWVQSLIKSSTLITQSGAVYRADFFEKQRIIISEL
ncbi:MAG: hypothetical protein FWF53_04195 [Candidatus Azobacteroides sp.]|nr:hypothetical protein [Candidatus Azobacteroides sp.]